MKVMGVSRDTANPKVLIVHFHDEPTDGDLIMVHSVLRATSDYGVVSKHYTQALRELCAEGKRATRTTIKERAYEISKREETNNA